MTFVAKFKKKFYFVAAKYFRFFANLSFKRWNPRIIAITGSAGKTTMLHLVEYELKGKAHYSHNANSAFGVAFDIVGLRGITGSKLRWFYLFLAVPIRSLFYTHKEKFYIVEIDGERPHETEFLASWLKPEVTIWISLGRSHAVQFEHEVASGKFDNLDEAITHEFATLPEHTTKQVYIDGDIKLMRDATKNIKAKVTSFKKSSIARYIVYPEHTDFTFGGTTFHFDEPQPRDISIQLLMLRDLMKYLKLPLNSDFSDLEMPPGRSSFFKGKKGLKIIDSSYNAHIISMQTILDMVKSLHAEHKWLIIGDIVDQGSIEEEEHIKLAHLIADVKPEKIILIGRRTKKYTAPELKKLGCSAQTTLDPKKALAYIEKTTTGKETLIFKGSQYLEWIIEKLLENPEDAAKLPRRENAAKRRRKKRGLDS
ncbi:hypothetical protein IJI94_02295 [Candidatus Saccharibacteria bacterium]|nr:hypothetical protein [Candidatus Saccharibacteria bacterium]